MVRENTENACKAAGQMLEAFQSVGAASFDLTLTNLRGEKLGFRRRLALENLLHRLRGLMPTAEEQQTNVIVRPVSRVTTLVQLDDLKDAARLEQIMAVAFLAFTTSPGNHQAWVAVSGTPDEDFARRLKQGAGADPAASGATRIAGSVNFKPGYQPHFPRVGMVQRAPGRIVAARELIALGLVAVPEERPDRVSPLVQSRPGRRRIWPDYRRCIDGAPRNHGDTGPDISRADFVWCRTALAWGFGLAEVAARLLEQSNKARAAGQGERYVRLTAEKAAASLREGSGPQRGPTAG
jgi:RepB DNA-primase from phage plasmid